MLALVAAAGCAGPQRAGEDAAILAALRTEAAIPVTTSSASDRSVTLDDGVTPDEAVAVALGSNSDILAARYARDASRARAVDASKLENPSLRLGIDRADAVRYGGGEWRARVEWDVPQPLAVVGQRRRGAAESDVAEADLAEREWMLACDVRALHAERLSRQRALDECTRSSEARRQVSEVVERRFRRGASDRLERSLARLAAARAQADQDEAQADVERAAARFARLVGAPAAALWRLVPGPARAAIAQTPSADALLERAWRSRPSLREARARREASEWALRLAGISRWPWFELAAGPELSGALGGRPSAVDLGIRIRLPVFDWGEARVAAARAERERRRALVAAAAAQVRLELEEALASLRAGDRATRTHDEVVKPELEESERATQAAIASGRMDLAEVLAAADMAARQRRYYNRALLERELAWIALERAVGERLEPAAGEEKR